MNPQRSLLKVLTGDKPPQTPIWLMRQAGRYLPEYRQLRAQKGSFLNLVYDSDAAFTVTKQPIDRFGFDGAILFSDILVVAQALGQTLTFEEGEGPRLAPRLIDHQLADLVSHENCLNPIYTTVARLRAELPAETTLLGFAGSPWTVATYMLNGVGSKDQTEARVFAYRSPALMKEMIAAIEALTISYLGRQIEAGVDVVQLFESWSGSLAPEQFEQWVIAPNARIVADLRARYPHIPIICFPKGAGAKLVSFVDQVKPSAIGLDETVDPIWAHSALPSALPVQGNLDPLALLVGGQALNEAIAQIMTAFADRPHIFNLGHGILPSTPIAHVEHLVATVRSWTC